MPSERFFVHKEDGSLVRLKGRLVRFLDEEPPTGSDKSAIRTALEVSPDAEGLVQADVGTGPQNLVLHQHLGTLAYADAESVSAAKLQVESTTGTATTQALTVTDGSSTNFVVQEDGQTGIGTASPSSYHSNANKLVVGSGSGSEGLTIASGATGLGVIYFADGTSGTDRYDGYVYYDHSSRAMRLGAAGSLRWSINSSGNLVSSGGGIDFGSGATLSDYEEGTFQTSLTALSSGTVTLDANTDVLAYTKVGSAVTVTGLLQVSAVSSPSGAIQMTIPFVIGNYHRLSGRFGTVMILQRGSALSQVVVNGNETDSFVYIEGWTPAASDYMRFCFTYNTTA